MTSYECPYVVGAEFTLLLNPPPYMGLSLTNSSTSEATRIRVKVLQTFSFTKSQTLKISITKQFDKPNPLPSIAFLKLYDRRYLDERTDPNAKYPWNPEKEAEAKRLGEEKQSVSSAEKHTSGRNGIRRYHLLDNPEASLGDEDSSEESSSENGSGNSTHSDRKGTANLDQWQIEERYRFWTKKWFKTETEAYKRLQSLQGLSIPKFFGIVSFESEQGQPQILIEVRGILLQFIDGRGLDEIHSESSIALTHKHIGQAAVIGGRRGTRDRTRCRLGFLICRRRNGT